MNLRSEIAKELADQKRLLTKDEYTLSKDAMVQMMNATIYNGTSIAMDVIFREIHDHIDGDTVPIKAINDICAKCLLDTSFVFNAMCEEMEDDLSGT